MYDVFLHHIVAVKAPVMTMKTEKVIVVLANYYLI